MPKPQLPISRPRRPFPRHRWTLLGALLLLLPEAALAQLVPGLPIAVELRTGAALPVGDFAASSPGLDAGTGMGGALALHAHVTPSLAGHVSYDYGLFTCVACVSSGFGDRMPEAGFELGVEWIPFRPAGLDAVLGAGILLGRRLEIPDGGDGFASEASTGWSVGGGLRIPVGPLRLLPGIRYRTYTARFDFPELGFDLGDAGRLEQELQVASVSLEVGLSYEL